MDTQIRTTWQVTFTVEVTGRIESEDDAIFLAQCALGEHGITGAEASAEEISW
jgi:hypothetical protein